MSRVISYTPPWLSRPSPGWDMFAPRSTAQAAPIAGQDTGRRRKIATRNSEAFVAVGTEIRWGDLAALKEGEGRYRTLKASVPLPITQLVISPLEDYMAVATSHTVHIVVLPDAKLLEEESNDVIKLRTFQVGPTAHVREESPVASLLWHPLGPHGRCLVTITREGVVRLWEVNRSDRSTFSDPTLSIDLQKLANATNANQDVSASKYGASKGFSPDSVELEVASACFGDYPEQEGVHGWAPMTLWIAMVEGDIYALCPLLPTRWQLPETPGSLNMLQTLTTSINTLSASLSGSDASEEERETAQTQSAWLADIVYTEPWTEQLSTGEPATMYKRPQSVPACPRLQGPFTLSATEIEDFETSDIIVYSLKTFSESMDDEPAEGVPASVVCLLTDSSDVHISLDLQGIVGRWLPQFNEEDHKPLEPITHEFVVVETVALTSDNESSFNQSITPDVQTDFSFFVSHPQGVFYISMENWIRQLERELAEPQAEGLDFRLGRILESAITQAEQVIARPSNFSSPQPSKEEVNACAVIADGNLGYFVLTTIDYEPQAVILDAPEHELPIPDPHFGQELELPARQPRPTYQVPKEFYEGSLQFHSTWESYIPPRHKAASKEVMNLSPANLDILINVHKALSSDTHKLESAVSDLFVRCNRLREEFRDQILRVATLVQNVDSVTGRDIGSDDDDAYNAAKVDQRLDAVKKRQDALNKRYEDIRRKMHSVGGTDLSEKESGYREELETMNRSLDRKAQNLADDPDGSDVPAWQRLEHIKSTKEDLERRVEKTSQQGGEERTIAGPGGVKVPSHSRKLEQEQIDALLERESALVEAATTRLRSMGISIPTQSAL